MVMPVVGGWVQFKRESTPTLPPLSYNHGEIEFNKVPLSVISASRSCNAKPLNVMQSQSMFVIVMKQCKKQRTNMYQPDITCTESDTAFRLLVGSSFFWWPALEESRRVDERGRYSHVTFLSWTFCPACHQKPLTHGKFFNAFRIASPQLFLFFELSVEANQLLFHKQ